MRLLHYLCHFRCVPIYFLYIEAISIQLILQSPWEKFNVGLCVIYRNYIIELISKLND